MRYLTDELVISGGEDTTLRLSIVSSTTNALKPVAIIRSHISSVRSIDLIELDDFFIVVTAGGRAQLKVWKIKPEKGTDYL